MTHHNTPDGPDVEPVVAAVRRHIAGRTPGGVTLEVESIGVRREEDWWYVPIRPSEEPKRRYEYYETLAKVERDLLRDDGLTVLLVPAAPFSVDFQFKADSTDLARAALYNWLRSKYSAGGVAGVLDPYLHVQPGGNYWVLVDNPAEAETVAQRLREDPSVEAESVSVKMTDRSLWQPERPVRSL